MTVGKSPLQEYWWILKINLVVWYGIATYMVGICKYEHFNLAVANLRYIYITIYILSRKK